AHTCNGVADTQNAPSPNAVFGATLVAATHSTYGSAGYIDGTHACVLNEPLDLTKVAVASDATPNYSTTAYSYVADGSGRLAKAIGPQGEDTRYQYDGTYGNIRHVDVYDDDVPTTSPAQSTITQGEPATDYSLCSTVASCH